MAAPVRVEAVAFSDPRYETLGVIAGYNRHEALGRMALLWSVCTERSTYVVSEAFVVGALGPRGVDALLGSELGERVDSGIRVRGTQGRTEWRDDLASKRQHAGRVRAASAVRDESGRLTTSTEPAPDQHNSSTDPAQSSALTLSPSLLPSQEEEKNSATPAAGGKRSGSKRQKPTDPSEAELASIQVVLDKLSRQNGVRYSSTPEHARLIMNQLRAGVTEMDLRAVIGYCAMELDWKADPEMAKYLRPETLFGPKTIARYLDPARTWAAKRAPRVESSTEEEPSWMRTETE